MRAPIRLAWLCLSIILCAAPLPAQQLILQENWESGSLGNWGVSAAGSCSVDTTNPHSGSRALTCNRTANWLTSNDVYTPTKSGYLSFWQWNPQGFRWINYVSGVGHWFRIYLKGWEYQIDIGLANLAGAPTAQSPYMLVMQGFYGGDANRFDDRRGYIPFGDGRWHHVELQYDLNTAGQANGFLRIWYDGQKIYDRSNYEFSPTGFPSTTLERLALPSNAGTDDPRPTYFDDIELWSGCPVQTNLSGPSSCGGAAAPPPALPTVSILNMANGQQLSGTVTLTASASSSASTIAGVQFLLDGKAFGPELTSPPFSLSLNTTLYDSYPRDGGGWHTLQAVARDALGKIGFTPEYGPLFANSGPPTGGDTTAPGAPLGLRLN